MTAKKITPLTKMLLSGVLGGVAGYVSIPALLVMVPRPDFETGAVALSGVGLVYLLAGLLVTIGSFLPGMGAYVLNVADRDELEDMRATLLPSGIVTFTLGLGMIALSFSGPQGLLTPAWGFGALIGAVAISVVVSFGIWARCDELLRQLSQEGASYGLMLLLPAIILWAGLAHIGWIATIDPLGLIALGAALYLVGAFIATGRRGLLTPR